MYKKQSKPLHSITRQVSASLQPSKDAEKVNQFQNYVVSYRQPWAQTIALVGDQRPRKE